MTKGPVIKIAPTPEEQKEQKRYEKQLDVFRVDEIDEKTKIPISERNKDQFFGGPLDSWVCDHQPNGPVGNVDPKGYWADYFIKDQVKDENLGVKIPGYHIYSTFNHKSYFGMLTDDLGMGVGNTMGARTVRNRKCYYYVGFVSESVLAVDGIDIDRFTAVLTMS